jgi:hypothetical protein
VPLLRGMFNRKSLSSEFRPGSLRGESAKVGLWTAALLRPKPAVEQVTRDTVQSELERGFFHKENL